MLQAAAPDTTIALLDTSAAQTLVAPSASPTERAMLSENKLPVVLAVVLVVWAALMLLALRTDRRLARVERALDSHDSRNPHAS